jgi:hypothetical protein
MAMHHQLTSIIHSIVSNDLLRYRGCRAGRHVQERRQRTATDLRGTAANETSTTLPGGGHWLAPTEGINITTVVGRRLNRGNFHGRGNSRPRVLADMTRHTAVPKQQLGTVQAGFTPANILVQPPRLYVFNAAAITKPNAVQQLSADITSMEIDVAIISETKLKSKHPDSINCLHR